jgi:DNA (cytosine-5)-methyltransferase 1
MKYLSLFSGIGGFELGIQQAYEELLDNQSKVKGLQAKEDSSSDNCNPLQGASTCIGYSEIDKYAIQVYEKHFNHKNYGDITKIKAEELPDFDFLCGGFPCQAFSIAGKRRGFEDTRGTLFFDIARILREKQPTLLLLENVKGLLSHEKGDTFKTIIRTLDELGYDCQWQVLNSKNFGVPQNRERVFIIGHLRGTSRPEVFPIGGTNEEDTQSIINPLKGKTKFGWHCEKNIFDKKGISRAVKASGGSGNQLKILQLNQPKHSNDRVYSDEGLSPTLNTMQGGNRQPFIAPVLTPDRLNKRQNGRRFKENGDPSFTLTSQDRHGVYDGQKIRRLTPLECERLMSWPDNWTKYGINEKGEKVEISDSQRYKMCGNGVVSSVVKEIIKLIICG